ncbi:hypothetical protein FOL47_001180 [Perkinsus chesapeaki]|uniref:Uncharacterized protein n=1 Tax=Perkinsus chesapeaki TaxID=330153 RepID=A0A7J6KU24_PERCH|nr:hypothetical protein FOL47_001180 [Perkinsus chesapeaki]|mmetsp:Transcript_2730/g.2967  ORF Transcript_2730/g.2967 Transcript_2730/m.2967 type:complete len:139 (+) Transcript_2730:61-477(+)
MPKAPHKSRSAGKKKRATPFESTAMDVDTMADQEKEAEKVVEEVEEDEKAVSNREIFRRHAEEWKKMKVQVADLKRQRKKLPKKGNKDKKKLISQEIKKLVSDLKEQHDRELEDAGISSGSVKYKKMEIEIDDDEDAI